MVNPPVGARRALPSVDRLLQQTRVVELITQYGRPLVVESIRAVIDAQRAAMAQQANQCFVQRFHMDAAADNLQKVIDQHG